MKGLFRYAISLLLIFSSFSLEIHGSEDRSIHDKTQVIIANKYAERYCSAKANHLFEGLDNEKKLKYSYYKYIGLQSEEILSSKIYPHLIIQIKNKCNITTEEESELNKFLLRVD